MTAGDEDADSSDAGDAHPDAVPAAPKPVRIACVILAAESLALLGIAGFLLVSTVTGHPDSVARALVGAALALIAAAAVGAGARGLLRLSPAARTPVVVIQLLAVPVGYSLGFQAGRVAYGGPILIAALTVIYLLFSPPARAALDRELR